jgi:hypothetical protein
MYTNIDTDHALGKIASFLRTSPLCFEVIYGLTVYDLGTQSAVIS